MRLPTGRIAGQIYQFTLEAAEEIFRHRIVVGLALPGHALHKAQFFELLPVRHCRILHAPIRMKHQSRCRMLPPDCHAKCRQGQRRIDAVGKRIPHHLLGAKIFYDCQGDTTQRLCGRCANRFFVRLHRNDAGILSYFKEFLCDMTENSSADAAQSRQACFAWCRP